jgi:hypothetical protein
VRSRWVVDRSNSFQWGDVASERWILRALMSSTPKVSIAVCLALGRAIGRAQSLDDIYTAALDALRELWSANTPPEADLQVVS